MTGARSLGTRLTAFAAMWIVILLAGGGFALSYAFTKAAEQSFERELDIFLGALISSVRVNSDNSVAMSREIEDPRFAQLFSGWYWQVSKGPEILIRSRSLWDHRLDRPSSKAAVGTITEEYFTGPRGRTLCARSRTLKVDGGNEPMTFVVTGDTAEIAQQRVQFNTILIVSLGLLGLGTLTAILLQVRFGLAPLRVLTRELEGIRNGTRFDLTTNHPEEMMPLVRAMNAVLDENQSRIDVARKHVGNIAHALKTPITMLRAAHRQGGAVDESGAMQQLDSISELIEHHMTRAAAAGNAPYLSTIIDAAEVIDAVSNGLARLFADKGLRIELDVAPGLTFLGERQDAEELFGNLMENACKWARHRVLVKGEISGNDLLIMVEDDGDGLPKPLKEQATIRGIRFDERAPGFGLGLSIVADLVEIYGGDLKFGISSLGGLSVLVKLPLRRWNKED